MAEGADALRRAQLPWEAARLTGAAAIRCDDRTVARTLLGRTRDLHAALPDATQAGHTSNAAPSEREQQVGTLLCAGLTRREMGEQHYVAPKTVEHHVAKLRQKLGVTTPAELMAALRDRLALA